jgi:hypothetical protein
MNTQRLADALLIEPDYGNAPFLWPRYGMRQRGNCCDACWCCGNHPMSQSLWRDMADWAIEFERAPHQNDDWSLPVLLDWVRFHACGMALAKRLKAEVGSIRVIYAKPFEDPDHERDGDFEIMADGSARLLPDWLGPPFSMCREVVSGGQTGVDRAALDFALANRYLHGGWCPKGRKAEDGPIPERYDLVETESKGYRQRTKRNVIDSDGTLIFTRGELSGGTLETLRIAERAGKPHLVVALDGLWEPQFATVCTWLQQQLMPRLNVAGPRESKCLGIYGQTLDFLQALTSQPYEGSGGG